MAGYNRKAPNPFVDGAIIEANDFDTEFGNLDIAFGTSGHTHDGTDGNGPTIGTAGITDLAVTDAKLAADAVTTVKILDDAVTGAKIDSTTTITAASFVGPLTGNVTGNLDANSATIDSLTITSGTAITSIDTDLSSVSAFDDTLASAKAIKAYVDAQVDTADQLTELTDVTITSVADNEVLAYDNASSKWINQTAVEAGLQPNDAGLTSIAGLTTSENQMIYTTGSDTYATTSLTAAGRAILDDADASAQRTTLGLVIGTNVQAYNAGLADIAGLAKTDGNIIVGDGTNWVAESGATARASLGLTIGTNVQAYDAGLASIAGLTTLANKMIYTTASDTYAVTDLSAFGRTLIDDADAATARTTLGLGTAATTAATAYATAAQGALADSAVQPADNISTLTNDSGYITGYTVTESDVTAHQAALSITESQISDLQSYLTGNQTITLSGDATGSGTTSISVSLAANTVGINELNLSDGTAGQFLKTDGAGNISFATAPTQQTTFTVLDVDNINLDGNTISSTNSNGNLRISPNGTGVVEFYKASAQVSDTDFFRDQTFASGFTYVIAEQNFYGKDNAGVKTNFAQIQVNGNGETASSGTMYIGIASQGTGPRPATGGTGFEISGSGDTISVYGDLSLMTGHNLKVRSGQGIDFSLTSDATGMSSELLDDYEEGGWTPNFSDGTTTVTTGGTRIGKYVKVGKMVTAWASISNATTAGLTSTASLRITGLPFTGENGNAIERANASVAFLEGVSFTSDPVIYLVNNNNRDYVNIWDQGAGTSIKVSDVTSGTNYISFTLTYLAG